MSFPAKDLSKETIEKFRLRLRFFKNMSQENRMKEIYMYLF